MLELHICMVWICFRFILSPTDSSMCFALLLFWHFIPYCLCFDLKHVTALLYLFSFMCLFSLFFSLLYFSAALGWGFKKCSQVHVLFYLFLLLSILADCFFNKKYAAKT